MDLWIGTSGYAYPDWCGAFYPHGTNSKEMLRFYADRFPLVELNFSYYHMPTSKIFEQMGQRVPANFQFIVKANRTMTHEPDASQLPIFRESLQPMRQSGQLLYVLAQFPQAFHCSLENRQWIMQIRESLGGAPLAVEFRHESWDRAHVDDWLRGEGVTLVSVDVPAIAMLYPRKLVQTGRDVYVRLHSRRASSWYGEGTERYDYEYSDEELMGWVHELESRADQTERAMILFNNCQRSSAVINAQRLMTLLGEREQPFKVIAPPPRPRVQQGMLF